MISFSAGSEIRGSNPPRRRKIFNAVAAALSRRDGGKRGSYWSRHDLVPESYDVDLHWSRHDLVPGSYDVDLHGLGSGRLHSGRLQ